MGRAPLILDLHPDLRVLIFTAAISTLAAILFGLAPALGATRLDLTPALKQTSQVSAKAHGSSNVLTQSNLQFSFCNFHFAIPSSRRRRLTQRKLLLIAQVALSILLLCGTGLLVRTLINLEKVDPGFDRKNVLLFTIDPKKTGYKGPAL